MKAICNQIELKTWKFALDQTQYGESAGWATPEYDDSRWISVDSYTAWETYDRAMEDYEGCGWFRTTFRTDKGNRKMLRFNGIGGVAKVFVNGRYAGGAENRYLPFELDITQHIKDGENLIAVLVDNRHRGAAHLPGGSTVEWVLYGGLNHRVWIEEQPAEYISNVRIDAGADRTAKITVTVKNRVSAAHLDDFKGSIVITIPQLDYTAQQIVECPKKGKIQVVFQLEAPDAELWSPENPNLYQLEAVLYKNDAEYYRVEERFGFRTICTEGTNILLNGQEILLKGVNRYDEYAPYGNCAPEDVIRQDLQAIKDMGFNLIRTHYPQDPIHYEIADELGLMYMIEVPLNWWKPKAGETFADFCGLAAEAVDALDRTFQCFCNHPCWTVWSTGNECFHSHPAANEMFHMLAARMRGLDCGRLITYAANQPLKDSQELDFCDILSMNYYSGILSENVGHFPEQLVAVLEKKMALVQELYPDIPHIMSEFGYVCVYGIHGSTTEGRYTEDFGATFLREDIKQFLRNPQMKGLVLWCWADYRHRRGFVPGAPGSMGFCATYGPWGLVTIDRKRKEMLIDVMEETLRNWK